MIDFRRFASEFSVISEATVGRHEDTAYVVNPNYEAKWVAAGFDPPPAGRFENLAPEDAVAEPGPFWFMSGKSKTSLERTKRPSPKGFSFWKAEGGDGVFYIRKGTKSDVGNEYSTDLLVQSKGAGETDTVVKEAMVAVLFALGIGEKIESADDFASVRSAVSDEDSWDSGAGLDGKSKKKLREYFVVNAYDKKTVAFMNDKISVAAKLIASYDPSEWFVDRDTMLPDIKESCKRAFNFAKADKWNPSDLFLVRTSVKDTVQGEIDGLIEDHGDEVLAGHINALFESTFGAKKGDIVGISLKEGVAQCGGVKSYLDKKDAEEYNITKEEIKKDRTYFEAGIANSRKKLSDYCRKNGIQYNYIPARKQLDPAVEAEKTYVKFGAYKIMSYVISEGKKDIFTRLILFGTGREGKANPAFFKVTGNAKGDATVELQTSEFKKLDTKTIAISDSDEVGAHKGIVVLVDLEIDGVLDRYPIDFRSQGSKGNPRQISMYIGHKENLSAGH